MSVALRTLIVSMLAVTVARSASAQSCGYFYACSGDQHYVWGAPENNDNAHSHCLGPCAPGVACHPLCRAEHFAKNPELKKGYEAVVAAANAGDVATVLSLASGTPGFVAFNAQRRAVQLKACSGEFIAASLPVQNDALLRVAMRLPTPTEILAVAHGAPNGTGR